MTTSTSTAGSQRAKRSEPVQPGVPPAQAPSPDLLEFLGEFSDDDGGWIDPLDLEDPETAPEQEKGDGR